MVIFNGKKYAESGTEFSDTLFQADGTANGYARRAKGGIKIFNLQNELIAFIVAPRSGDPAFVVSAHTVDGRPRYLFSTTEQTEKYLGLDSLGYMEKINACEDVFQKSAAM